MSEKPKAESFHAIVRTLSAGVFAGEIDGELADVGDCVVVRNARRLWYWDGAASLSEMAVRGPRRPKNCKFPCSVGEVKLFGVIEVIPTTDKARKAIEEVPIWTA